MNEDKNVNDVTETVVTEQEQKDEPAAQEEVTAETAPEEKDTKKQDKKAAKEAEKQAKEAEKAAAKQAKEQAKKDKKSKKSEKPAEGSAEEVVEEVTEEVAEEVTEEVTEEPIEDATEEVVEETAEASEEATEEAIAEPSAKEQKKQQRQAEKAEKDEKKQAEKAAKKALKQKKKAYNKRIHKTRKTILKVLKAIAVSILLIIISVILLVVLLVPCFAIGEKIMFSGFYSKAKRFEKIPAAWEKFVPQGYIFVEEPKMRLACGYMSDGSASRIYILENKKDPVCVVMKNSNGSDYTGHTGGIDDMGDFVYVTGAEGCDIFSLADIMDGDGIATVKGEVKTIVDPAYCVIRNGVLYAGSFYRAGNYETPMSHRYTTPAGDENTALIAAYTLDGETGLAVNKRPDFVISTTGLVQGMTFIDDNTVVLATSYGLAKSRLYVYDLSKMTEASIGFKTDGERVPLKFLDSACLKDTIVAPPMAEQIVYANGRIYIMHEAASMKYIFGKFTSGPYVYGYKY